jgi:hypothetical protein
MLFHVFTLNVEVQWLDASLRFSDVSNSNLGQQIGSPD